ncbi:hypothetical protein ACOMHN_065081 [Nucella lapillus]
MESCEPQTPTFTGKLTPDNLSIETPERTTMEDGKGVNSDVAAQSNDAPCPDPSFGSRRGAAAAAADTSRGAGSRRPSMARLAVRRYCCLLLVGLTLLVLGVVTTMRAAVRVNITAIFEEEHFQDLQAVFYRTLRDFNNASQDVHWFGQAVPARSDLKDTLSAVCNLMEGRRSSLHVLVVFGNVSTIQTVNLLSQTLGIPVLGFMMDKGDGYIQPLLCAMETTGPRGPGSCCVPWRLQGLGGLAAVVCHGDYRAYGAWQLLCAMETTGPRGPGSCCVPCRLQGLRGLAAVVCHGDYRA